MIADIHFNHTLALKAIDAGAHCIRLNPGNIGGHEKTREVVERARAARVPMRIGVNSGSLPKRLHALEREDPVAALVGAAVELRRAPGAARLRGLQGVDPVTSVPNITIASNRLLAERIGYPLHLGITEAGTKWSGSLKSAVGLGALLADGIGDTIRISLSTFHAEEEVKVAEGAEALKLRQRGPVLIACPTCGRLQFDMDTVVAEIEDRLRHYDEPIEVAVLGCAVNGIGEASHADFGITGARNEGLIFAHGKPLRKVRQEQLVDALFAEIEGSLAAGRVVVDEREARGRRLSRADRGGERRRAHARADRGDGGGRGQRNP